MDLHSAPILQIREDKGGRGGAGFPMVASKTLPEILEDPEYRDLLEDLKTQLLRLLKDGIELGLVTKEEVQ